MEVRELCFGRIFRKRISRLSEAPRGTTAQVRFVNGRAQENWASTENAASAKKRSLEKYIVMCHGNGLLLITTNEALPNHARLRVPLLRREIESLRPPPSPFLEKISCLVVIMGKTGDSGQGLGLDEKSKKREIKSRSRTISGSSRVPLPDSRSGLIMGDSGPFSYWPKSRHEYETSYYRTKSRVSVRKLDQ